MKWEYDAQEESIYEIQEDGWYGYIVSTRYLTEADAHLIAAAPELLEALEEVVDGVVAGLKRKDVPADIAEFAVSKARAAIAKARGKQEAAPKGRSSEEG